MDKRKGIAKDKGKIIAKDKGKGSVKDHVPDDGINYKDDDYDDLLDDGVDPDIPLYSMGFDLGEDAEDMEGVAADAVASVEGTANAFKSADINASESSMRLKA